MHDCTADQLQIIDEKQPQHRGEEHLIGLAYEHDMNNAMLVYALVEMVKATFKTGNFGESQSA